MKLTTSKVAVITGAGSGIGRELAKRLACAQYNLALSDIDPAGLADTVASCQTSAIEIFSQPVDVAQLDQVRGFRENVSSHFRAIDLLINNAGVAFNGEVEHTAYDEYQWVMDINFWGVVYGCKEFLPLMAKHQGAHIVNLCSVFGLIALPSQSAYNASKFAVRGFTEAMQQELKGQGIGVSGVYPGGIKTNIVSNSRRASMSNKSQAILNLEQAEFLKALKTTPAEAARTILQGVKRQQSRILVGRDAVHLDRLVRLLPQLYTTIIDRGIKRAQRAFG